MTHDELVHRARRWLRNSAGCLWVLQECKAGFCYPETADAIGWTRRGLSILIECKTSLEDFTRDKRKSFRHYPEKGMGVLRYYMCPAEAEEKILPRLPERWGLLVVRGKSQRVYRAELAQAQPTCDRVEISLILHHIPVSAVDGPTMLDILRPERGTTMAIEDIVVINARKEGNYLYVTVQAPSQEEAVSPEARKIAYEARDEYGFSTAGIEAFGGTIPVDLTQKDEEGVVGKPLTASDLKGMTQDDHRQRIGYRSVFRLMRGM